MFVNIVFGAISKKLIHKKKLKNKNEAIKTLCNEIRLTKCEHLIELRIR